MKLDNLVFKYTVEFIASGETSMAEANSLMREKLKDLKVVDIQCTSISLEK